MKFSKSELLQPGRPTYYDELIRKGKNYYFNVDGSLKQVIFKEDITEFVTNFYETISNPAALRGSLAVYKAITNEYFGISRRDVEGVLKNLENQQLFKPAPSIPVSRPQVPRFLNQQISVDTAYVEHNGERLFTVLVAVELLSKYLWARMVKIPETHQRFSGKTVAAAMEDILIEIGKDATPSTIKSDNGPEFVSKDFNAVLAKHQIKHLYSIPHNPRSNAFAESAVKSLKILIGKYLNSINGIYIDNKTLQTLVDSYNHTYHSTIKNTPINVYYGPSDAVSAARANIKSRAVKVVNKTAGLLPPLKVGDDVRVHNRVESSWRRYTKLKKRIYETQWSEEIFKIIFVTKAKPGLSSHYYLSIDGEKIPHPYLRADLQLVDKSILVKNLQQNHYVVERVIDSKVMNGEKYYLIVWAGFPVSQATWEKEQKGYQKAINEYLSKVGKSKRG